MATLSLGAMRQYLGRSLSSLNRNKLNGLLAEVDFRRHLRALGYDGRVSPGGWLLRRTGSGTFGHGTVVLFPETLEPGVEYGAGRPDPPPSYGLHTICATFHQSGIHAYFLAGQVVVKDDATSVRWRSVQLGLPQQQPYQDFPTSLDNEGFLLRQKRYNHLRYKTDPSPIPDEAVPEEFSKEHARVSFSDRFMAESSDVDGFLWGKQHTYPVEIKEKTSAHDSKVGDYFGLDVGPFVKLAYYAANRGNLHALYVVREIDSVETRHLRAWWCITFETLARYASWVPIEGGTNMLGGRSSVVKVPKAEFVELDAAALEAL